MTRVFEYYGASTSDQTTDNRAKASGTVLGRPQAFSAGDS